MKTIIMYRIIRSICEINDIFFQALHVQYHSYCINHHMYYKKNQIHNIKASIEITDLTFINHNIMKLDILYGLKKYKINKMLQRTVSKLRF